MGLDILQNGNKHGKRIDPILKSMKI